jgi:hypothetical protein
MNDNQYQENQTAKEKAIAVIESCTTCDHFENAVPYLELYLKSYSDQEGYNELVVLFKNKKIELNCHEI